MMRKFLGFVLSRGRRGAGAGAGAGILDGTEPGNETHHTAGDRNSNSDQDPAKKIGFDSGSGSGATPASVFQSELQIKPGSSLGSRSESGSESADKSEFESDRDSEGSDRDSGNQCDGKSHSPSPSPSPSSSESQTAVPPIIERQGRDEEPEQRQELSVQAAPTEPEHAHAHEHEHEHDENPRSKADVEKTSVNVSDAGNSASTSTITSTPTSTELTLKPISTVTLPHALSRHRPLPLLLGPPPPPLSTPSAPSRPSPGASYVPLSSKLAQELQSLVGSLSSIGSILSEALVDSAKEHKQPTKKGTSRQVDFTVDGSAAVNLEKLASKVAPEVVTKVNVGEVVAENVFERSYVSKEMGFGLIAKKHICAGTIVFADELLVVWGSEEKRCRTRAEAEALLHRKAKKMGSEWYAQFLSRYELEKENVRKRVGCAGGAAGVMGPVWETQSLPTALNGRVGSIFGLNLTSINHACIPNCSLRFRREYSLGENGYVDWDKKPKLGRAVVIASEEIPAGAELTISYTQARGSTQMRQKQIKQLLNFRCRCEDCAKPHPEIESVLYKYHRLGEALRNPTIIANKPAVAFRVAAELIDKLTFLQMYDIRLVDIWVQCALIAGYHSDMARAFYFLSTARDLVLVLEGMTSSFYRHIEQWLCAFEIMPGYGGTTRGLSFLPDCSILGMYEDPRRILFMEDARPDEYVRLSRYRLLVNRDRTGNKVYKKSGPKKEPIWRIVEGLDPVPPELKLDTKNPHDMCRGHRECQAAERMDRMARRRHNQRKKRRQSMRKTFEKLNPDCVNPEKDFLTAYKGLVREMFGLRWKGQDNSEDKPETASAADFELEGAIQVCACEKHRKQHGDGFLHFSTKNKRTQKETEPQALVVQDVEARKEVKVVNGSEVEGPHHGDTGAQ